MGFQGLMEELTAINRYQTHMTEGKWSLSALFYALLHGICIDKRGYCIKPSFYRASVHDISISQKYNPVTWQIVFFLACACTRITASQIDIRIQLNTHRRWKTWYLNARPACLLLVLPWYTLEKIDCSSFRVLKQLNGVEGKRENQKKGAKDNLNERRGRKEESNTTSQKGGFGNKGHHGDRTGGQAPPPKWFSSHSSSAEDAASASRRRPHPASTVFISIQLLPFKTLQSISQGALHIVILTWDLHPSAPLLRARRM